MSDFVFKVNRAEIGFKAHLSNGEMVDLRLLETNARQLNELMGDKNEKNDIELSIKHLRENLIGDKKEDFISDLLENGSLDNFYTSMSDRFRTIKEKKRKN